MIYTICFWIMIIILGQPVLRRGLRQHLRALGSASRLCRGSSPYDWDDLRRSPGILLTQGIIPKWPQISGIFKLVKYYLVGGLEHFLFFHINIYIYIYILYYIIIICVYIYILGIIIPTDELIFFRGVGLPPTSYGSAKSTIQAVSGRRKKIIL